MVEESLTLLYLGAPYHIGILRSGDGEYSGWGRPRPSGHPQDEHAQIIDYWRRAGILGTHRESSATQAQSRLYGRRGGSICSGEPHHSGAGPEEAISVGLSGLARLARADGK